MIALLAYTSVALASPVFPQTIDAHLSLGYEPDCTVCHATLAGGFGTVVQPFGQKMQARGCAAGDTTSLETALDALAAEQSDVDSDGVGDIQELVDGTDPNSADGAVDPPEYGCIGNVAPTKSAWPGAAIVLLGLAFTARRRA